MNITENLSVSSTRWRTFSSPEHAAVAYTDTGVVSAGEFHRQVAGISRRLLQRPEQRWALVCDDTLWFATGFMALAQAHKTVIL
ncbi:MAG: hypothetical protein ACRETA_13705, partial [Gammaproteobacteria bacterium]